MLAMQETQVPFLRWEGPLEKAVVTHSSSPAWRIPWREESGGLQSTKSRKKLDMTDYRKATRASLMTLVVKNLSANAGDARDVGLIPGLPKILWRRAWQSTLVFTLGKSYGQRKPSGPRPIASQRVGQD